MSDSDDELTREDFEEVLDRILDEKFGAIRDDLRGFSLPGLSGGFGHHAHGRSQYDFGHSYNDTDYNLSHGVGRRVVERSQYDFGLYYPVRGMNLDDH